MYDKEYIKKIYNPEELELLRDLNEKEIEFIAQYCLENKDISSKHVLNDYIKNKLYIKRTIDVAKSILVNDEVEDEDEYYINEKIPTIKGR